MSGLEILAGLVFAFLLVYLCIALLKPDLFS